MIEGRDQPHLQLLKDVSFQPVFIMGDHRSGTTLLYRLLDATGCFNVVRAYHIIRYDELLSNHLTESEPEAKQRLNRLFGDIGVTDRMIDGVKVTADLPEEYGFLLSETYNAPLRPENLPRFIELCQKVQYISDPCKPLLLKNPWDYFLNFMYVKQAFPNARFIFIQRHPVHIISSQIHAIRSSLQIKNPYLTLMSHWYRQLYRRPARRLVTRLLFSARLGLAARITTRHVVRMTNYFLKNVQSLPSTDWISLKYEELCESPEAIIGRILSFLELDPAAAQAATGLIDRRGLRPLPEVARRESQIRRQMKAYFDAYDYS